MKLTRLNDHMFQFLELGDLRVSIQASEIHYCTPKINSPNFDDYQEFEVALMKNKDFIDPKQTKHAHKSWAKYWNGDEVAGYMPKQEVIKMLQDLQYMFA